MKPLFGAAGAVLLAVGLLGIHPARSQGVQPSCGETTVVRRGDTLSSIAARCDVSEASVLAANPDVEGSADLQVGEAVRLRAPQGVGQRLGTQLDRFTADANDAVGRVANRVGSSVQDLLDKNPDLKSRLESLGSRVGLTSGEDKPAISVTPQSGRPGSTVTISGTGLPKSVPVAIGAGAPGTAFEVLQEARTSSDGTLDVHVQVPTGMSSGSAVVFVVRGDKGQVRARTGRFQLTP